MSATQRQTSRAGPGADEPTSEELAARVDRAVRRIAELDSATKEAAEEVKAAVEAAHQAGLAVIVRRMWQDERARELLFELVDDPVVHLLLSLHGIIRPGGTAEGKRVLDVMRPSATLISLDSVRAGPGRYEPGWVRTTPVQELPDGEITLMELVAGSGQDIEVIVVRLDDRLRAYRNACAHQGLQLEAAILDPEGGTLTCPWHGYCFDATSGRCLSAPGAQLEQLPLRVDDGHVWIRVDT
jgi:nitrite reductase/ring-hydroxylating ferredoxin subunit